MEIERSECKDMLMMEVIRRRSTLDQSNQSN